MALMQRTHSWHKADFLSLLTTHEEFVLEVNNLIEYFHRHNLFSGAKYVLKVEAVFTYLVVVVLGNAVQSLMHQHGTPHDHGGNRCYLRSAVYPFAPS